MKDIQGLIESLQGTCMKTLDNEKLLFGWEEGEDLTAEEYNELENSIFECDGCGWWCEVSEMGWESGMCSQCEEEEE
jgi:hypothetical protein